MSTVESARVLLLGINWDCWEDYTTSEVIIPVVAGHTSWEVCCFYEFGLHKVLGEIRLQHLEIGLQLHSVKKCAF